MTEGSRYRMLHMLEFEARPAYAARHRQDSQYTRDPSIEQTQRRHGRAEARGGREANWHYVAHCAVSHFGNVPMAPAAHMSIVCNEVYSGPPLYMTPFPATRAFVNTRFTSSSADR